MSEHTTRQKYVRTHNMWNTEVDGQMTTSGSPPISLLTFSDYWTLAIILEYNWENWDITLL